MNRNIYRRDINVLEGLTLESVKGMFDGSGLIQFKTTCGREFDMYHDQDCCETVVVEDIIGDTSDLIGSPILRAEERTDCTDSSTLSEWIESFTWTFYELATNKGSVTIRWLGTSNGYYGERVDFEEVIMEKGETK